MTETPAPPPPSRSRHWRGWLLGLALLVVALGVAGYMGWRALPGYIVREAARRGVELEPAAVDVSLDQVRLRGARFALIGVRGLRGEAEQLTVDLDGWTPTAVRAEGVEVIMAGDEPLTDLPGWSERFGGAGQPPLEATRVRLGWSERPDAPPSKRVVFQDASLSIAGAAGKLRGAQVIAFGQEISPPGAPRKVDLAWHSAPGALTIGLGSTVIDSAPVLLELRNASGTAGASPPAGAARPQLKITLAALPLDAVVAAVVPALEPRAAPGEPAAAAPRREPAAGAKVIIEGWAELPLPQFEPDERIAGSLRMTVRGWVPPHARELDGILFGDTTEISSSFTLPPARDALELPDLEVSAGALRLVGPGSVRRSAEAGTRAVVRADLSGSLPCTALARSAASARLGDVLGDLAGDFAARTLRGSVLVRVAMHAELDRLDAARIEPTAEVRCKLAL